MTAGAAVATAVAMPFMLPRVLGTVRDARRAHELALAAERAAALAESDFVLHAQSRELEQRNAQLEEQAVELEEQRASAQALAAELEQRNGELGAALVAADAAHAATQALVVDLRRTQADFDERERHFRRVVESGMIGILFWNATGEIADANDAFLRIVRYTRTDLDEGARPLASEDAAGVVARR